MITAVAQYYPWLKVIHLISVIAWMAGMLYLPRLFVNRTRATLRNAEFGFFGV